MLSSAKNRHNSNMCLVLPLRETWRGSFSALVRREIAMSANLRAICLIVLIVVAVSSFVLMEPIPASHSHGLCCLHCGGGAVPSVLCSLGARGKSSGGVRRHSFRCAPGRGVLLFPGRQCVFRRYRRAYFPPSSERRPDSPELLSGDGAAYSVEMTVSYRIGDKPAGASCLGGTSALRGRLENPTHHIP